MILRFHFSLLVAAVALSLNGCSPDISGRYDRPAEKGSADFSTFVAIGDSLTAGFADNALYRHGQENSYPAILAQQFALAGGGAFNQPLMLDGETGSMTLTGIGDLGLADRLMLVATGNPDRPAAPGSIIPTQSTLIDVPLVGPFNNMGVPGARFYHLGVPTYGNPAALPNANPFFIRSASSTGASMLGDTVVQMPTFFVLWIGHNDVLGYATSGGTGVDQTGNSDVTTYGANDITDPGFFATGGTGGAAGLPGYPTVVAMLKGGGAKGVLINVPDVATIPFFTTVPYDAIPMDADQAADANAGFATYNGFLQSIVAPSASLCPIRISQEEADRRQITFSEGANPIVILDENLTPLTLCSAAALEMRQATANDLILLPTLSKLGEPASPPYPADSLWGISGPLLDADVLIDSEIDSESEVFAVNSARKKFNETIKDVADADPNLLFFDAEAKLVELNETGILYGSGGVSSTFAQGGYYSLDGIHATARGNAVLANEIFKVINAGFDAYIPPVDPSDYTTVFYQ